jgi:hypothetical protein
MRPPKCLFVSPPNGFLSREMHLNDANWRNAIVWECGEWTDGVSGAPYCRGCCWFNLRCCWLGYLNVAKSPRWLVVMVFPEAWLLFSLCFASSVVCSAWPLKGRTTISQGWLGGAIGHSVSTK